MAGDFLPLRHFIELPGKQLLRILLLLTCACIGCHGAVCSSSFSWYADLANNIGVVRALQYIPDPNDLLVAGGEDQLLRVWTLSPFFSEARVLPGHQEAIWSLEWIPEYDVLASGSGDGTIRFWPIAVLLGGSESCSAPDFVHRQNDGLCMGSEGERVVSWRDAGIEKRHQVHSLVWAASIGQLVSGWSDTRIRTWYYEASSVPPENPWRYNGYLQSQDRVYDMVWSTTYSLLGTASPDQRHPRLWDSLTNTSGPIPPGTYTYLTEELGANNGYGDCPWAHCDAVLALAADATGEVLASGSMDNSVILWDAGTKNRLSQITGHSDYVTSVVWMDTEAKIASGSQDNTIKIWSVDNTTTDQSDPLETLQMHSGAVNALEWKSNESIGFLFSGSSDGSVLMWTCW